MVSSAKGGVGKSTTGKTIGQAMGITTHHITSFTCLITTHHITSFTCLITTNSWYFCLRLPSTHHLYVTVNLAVALASMGKRTGLLDTDIFGPSIPRMMRLDSSMSPDKQDAFTPILHPETNKLVPLINYGVQCMSMGFLVHPEKALVWRGMMVMKGIQQLLWEVEWDNVDVLVIGTYVDAYY